MLKKIFTFIVLVAASAATIAAPNFRVQQSLKSRFGEIQLRSQIEEDGNGPPSHIFLNDQSIFNASGSAEPYVKLIGLYNLTQAQALLISQNCGGSGCRVHQLAFILIKSSQDVVVVTSQEFNSETYTVSPSERYGEVVVDLGYFQQRKKIAILSPSGLSVSYQKSNVKALDEPNCRSLHGAMDACVREGNLFSRCTDYSSADFYSGGFSGSNADTWAVRMVSHRPGFNRDGFIAACRTACNSKALPAYEEFRRHACEQGQK